MTRTRTLLLAALCLALVGAWLQWGPRKPPKPLPKPAEGWTWYDDSMVRFQYPKGWKPWHTERPLHGERFWTADPPGAENKGFVWGAVDIYEYLDGREKRPLEQLIAETKWGRGKKVVAGPERLAIGGGDCMALTVEGWIMECGDFMDHDNPAPRPHCIEAIAYALCYNKRGNHVKIRSSLSSYYDRGQPDKQAKEHGRIFDHLVRSIEFK